MALVLNQTVLCPNLFGQWGCSSRQFFFMSWYLGRGLPKCGTPSLYCVVLCCVVLWCVGAVCVSQIRALPQSPLRRTFRWTLRRTAQNFGLFFVPLPSLYSFFLPLLGVVSWSFSGWIEGRASCRVNPGGFGFVLLLILLFVAAFRVGCVHVAGLLLPLFLLLFEFVAAFGPPTVEPPSLPIFAVLDLPKCEWHFFTIVDLSQERQNLQVSHWISSGRRSSSVLPPQPFGTPHFLDFGLPPPPPPAQFGSCCCVKNTCVPLRTF